MIGAGLGRAAASGVLAFVPAPAGTGAARQPVVLAAAPAHVSLTGNARAAVRVSNSGTQRVVVDATRAGFALDLRGRPRIVRGDAPRSASRWLALRPGRFVLGSRGTATLVVASRLPRHAEPGDHDALVLLSTHPMRAARVAVRVRLGVVVVVRAPGKVVRRLEIRALRLVGLRRRRALELLVANRGNVTESVNGARAVVVRPRTGRRLATVGAPGRYVRPRTIGLLAFPLPRIRGRVWVRIVIPAAAGRGALGRKFVLRL